MVQAGLRRRAAEKLKKIVAAQALEVGIPFTALLDELMVRAGVRAGRRVTRTRVRGHAGALY